jgi:hypothetical protein
MHPVNFHIGIYVAVAVLLITAMKSSEGIIAAVYYGGNQTGDLLSSTHMREAETHVGHAQMNKYHHPRVSGA